MRQYDISNPAKPKLTGQVFLGGKIINDNLTVVEDKEQKVCIKYNIILLLKNRFLVLRLA